MHATRQFDRLLAKYIAEQDSMFVFMLTGTGGRSLMGYPGSPKRILLVRREFTKLGERVCDEIFLKNKGIFCWIMTYYDRAW